MKTLDKQGIAVGNLRTGEECSSFLMMLTEMHNNQRRKTLFSIKIKEFALQLCHPFAYNEKLSVERMVKQIDDDLKPANEQKVPLLNIFQQLRSQAAKTPGTDTQKGNETQ